MGRVSAPKDTLTGFTLCMEGVTDCTATGERTGLVCDIANGTETGDSGGTNGAEPIMPRLHCPADILICALIASTSLVTATP